MFVAHIPKDFFLVVLTTTPNIKDFDFSLLYVTITLIGEKKMFKNSEELRELIRQGKSNDEIITEQLQYLNSDAYKQNKKTERATVGGMKSDIVNYHEGFISSDMIVASDGGYISDNCYKVDKLSLYDDLIDSYRKNLNKDGNIPLSIVIRKVFDYFCYDKNSKYKDIVEYINDKFEDGRKFAREALPEIIRYYKNSNFKESFTEFAKRYIWYYNGSESFKEKVKNELEEWKNSIDWECLDEHCDSIIDLSELKGAGVAMCTEKNMALQNCLAFLGFDTYFLKGPLISANNKKEQHNFVVVKTKDGKYAIADAAQYSIVPLENINSAEELKSLKNIKAKNGGGKEITYYSYLAEKGLEEKEKF